VRAVAFDLGDTLWHFPHPRPPEALQRAHLKRLEAALTAHEADPDAAPKLRQRLEDAWDEWDQAADAAGGAGPDYLAGTRGVMRELGLPDSRAAVAAVWQSMYLDGPFLGRRLFADTHDTLKWLGAAGYRLAVITNRGHGGEVFLEELHAYGLRDPFDVIVSSDQVGYRKPHPRIFEAALETMDLEAAEMAMVGDRPEADIAGANRLGMPSIWIRKVTPADRVPTAEDQRPDYTIDELSELRSLDLFAGDPRR
jgi:putative hydrolase of the HAD superfamily